MASGEVRALPRNNNMFSHLVRAFANNNWEEYVDHKRGI
jgi:hypothetical protein